MTRRMIALIAVILRTNAVTRPLRKLSLMSGSVKELEIIAWPDLGCEAVRRLKVEKMPLTVILDPHGGDLYTSGPQAYLDSLK